jgi:hypothetical protein
MNPVPLEWSGTATIAALIGLGIFLYPWLLRRRFGAVVVAACTAALAVLFYAFDRRAGVEPNAWLAVVWALLPAIAGVVSWWFSTRRSKT